MKLVITGHDEAGKSIFSHAGTPLREVSPGTYELWATSGALEVPDATDAMKPSEIGYFPVDGESAFKVVSIPGKAAAMDDSHAPMPEEIAHYFDSDDPGMHTTDTIDYVVILAGVAELELDDGRSETVRAGDCVVQRGTRHAWRVTSEEPLVLVATLLGAKRR
ncbi:MAG: cupin [Deltaproteobacteria bacterium]|jgi:mannose-6-phosphate isomerase-like protein (cupin superfamily)|nr:cupin [Deltaproteobacteria bacterium]